MALIDGLVSYYDGSYSSTTVTDIHGSTNGTASNSSVLGQSSSGLISDGFDFTSGIYFISGFYDVSNLTNFTISFWMKISSLPAASFPLAKDGGSYWRNVSYRFQLYNGNLNCGMGNTSDQAFNISVPFNSSNLDTWYHLVATFDGNTLTFYIDSVSKGTASFSGTRSTSGTPYIARRDAGEYLNGFIDEVGVWNRALSSTEVSDLYNSGNGLAYPFETGYISPFPSFRRRT